MGTISAICLIVLTGAIGDRPDVYVNAYSVNAFYSWDGAFTVIHVSGRTHVSVLEAPEEIAAKIDGCPKDTP